LIHFYKRYEFNIMPESQLNGKLSGVLYMRSWGSL